MFSRFVLIFFLVVISFAYSGAIHAKEFKVNGIMAWSEAKKNGFLFFPEGSRGNKTGAGENGKAVTTTGFQCMGRPAQMVGGVNMILNKCFITAPAKALNQSSSAFAHFYLFWGKTLKSGWSIKTITFSGSYQYTDQRYRPNTQRIATKLKLNNTHQQRSATKAMIKEVVLIGPDNGRWQDAFDVR